MKKLALLTLAATLFATSAWAEHCDAPVPKKGTVFSGKVWYVGDGDMICVGPSPDTNTWIEVRLADFYALELNQKGGRAARDQLRNLALNKTVFCVAGDRSYDRTIGSCVLNGHRIGDLLRAKGVQEGGRGYEGRPGSR